MDAEKIREVIQRVASQSSTLDDEDRFIRFVATEAYGMLVPRDEKPGPLFAWLERAGYRKAQIRSWLFEGDTYHRIPARVYAWGVIISKALKIPRPYSGCCRCDERAHSSTAQVAAMKRCISSHFLSSENLEEYRESARERVQAQYHKTTEEDPTSSEINRAADFHSDPRTFVSRAVHGNTLRLRLSTGVGQKEFGHSMLCAVMNTPGGKSEIRLKLYRPSGRKKPSQMLYDTRDGIQGHWESHFLYCPTCKRNVADPDYTRCTHPLLWVTSFRNEAPKSTERWELAECAGKCIGEDGKVTIWLYTGDQKKCPRCGSGRKRVKKNRQNFIEVDTTEIEETRGGEHDEYWKKQHDEDIPFAPPDSNSDNDCDFDD